MPSALHFAAVCVTIAGMRRSDSKKLREDRPSTRTVPRQLLAVLEEHIPGFRDEKYAFEIAWMLWCSVDPSRQHRMYDEAVSMHTDDIRRLFGEVSNFRKANRYPIQRYFNIYTHLNGTKSRKDSYTNGYVPRPWMEKALSCVIHSNAPIALIDKFGKAARIPQSPISSLDTHGNKVLRWRNVDVPVLIPISIDNLKLLAHRWEEILNIRHQQEHFEYILNRLDLNKRSIRTAYQQTKVFIAQAQCRRNSWKIPIRYVLHDSGRLYAEGLNLQSCKREIRQAALAGYWDVDISSCHPTIMSQMAGRFGLSCPGIDEYVRHKTEYRNQIAQEIGISKRQVKKIINAVCYGAPQSTSPFNEIPRRIGRDRAAAFFRHPLYLSLKTDIAAATRVILAQHPTKNNKLINLANRAIAKTTDKGAPIKKETLMAHLIQGVEAAALEAAVRACPGQVLLLQHDGMTTKEAVDPDLLKTAVLKETGYLLNFDVEQIKMPLEDLDLPTMFFNTNKPEPSKPSIHAGLESFWPVGSGTVAFSPCDVPPVYPLPLPPVVTPF